MTTLVTHTEKIENAFVKAIENKDRERLIELLDDHGEFMVQDINLETPVVDKARFIDWILDCREQVEINNFYFDQCAFCKIGNPVAIINDGSFPRKIKDSSEKEKAGLMFEIENNRIHGISFCYTFLETINKYYFEVEGARKIYKYMCDNHCSREEAIDHVFPFF